MPCSSSSSISGMKNWLSWPIQRQSARQRRPLNRKKPPSSSHRLIYQQERPSGVTGRPFFCFKFQLSAQPQIIKLPAYSDKKLLNIEHRTSNIEHPILMTLRFIHLNENESRWRRDFKTVESSQSGQIQKGRYVLLSIFSKLIEYIIRCWTFNVRCSMFIFQQGRPPCRPYFAAGQDFNPAGTEARPTFANTPIFSLKPDT